MSTAAALGGSTLLSGAGGSELAGDRVSIVAELVQGASGTDLTLAAPHTTLAGGTAAIESLGIVAAQSDGDVVLVGRTSATIQTSSQIAITSSAGATNVGAPASAVNFQSAGDISGMATGGGNALAHSSLTISSPGVLFAPNGAFDASSSTLQLG